MRVPLLIRRGLLPVAILLSTSGCAVLQDMLPRDDAGARSGPRGAPPALASRASVDPISRNYFVLESPEQSVIGELQIVFTGPDDTFSDLAREYGLGYDELVHANPGIDPWIPAAGTPVLLPTQYVLPAAARRGIVLNIAAKRLFYFPEMPEGERQEVLTYPIGIGRVGWETPLGSAKVIQKARDPHWYVPTSVRKEHAEDGNPLPAVVPPGPDNPLGRHVLKLDMPGYLIHGTNQPYGVGMRVSHGCVRLYPENIDTLYSLAGIGTDVAIVNQPYLLGRRDGQIFFESHPPLEDIEIDTAQHLDALLQSLVNSELLQSKPAAAARCRPLPPMRAAYRYCCTSAISTRFTSGHWSCTTPLNRIRMRPH
ncbi:MAG: L,D-transpeptidase family protein [Woeseiaceae bacterium]|nr:L,D-transpeptidase family protein [Woeseiaceae bacterium]